MKRFTVILAATIMLGISPALAQEEIQEAITLTETVPTTFGKVWRAIKKSMEEVSCTKTQVEKIIEPMEDGGLYKGQYFSEFCVLAQGADSTKDVIKRFSVIPRIRGGIWTTFRIQYKFNLKEEEGNKTKIVLRAQCSGYEEFITQETHFWNSNGNLEKEMMARLLVNIKKEIEGAKQE
jgi:hypothetical protein